MDHRDEEAAGLKESVRRAKEVSARCADKHPDTAAVFERKADSLVRKIARIASEAPGA